MEREREIKIDRERERVIMRIVCMSDAYIICTTNLCTQCGSVTAV